MVGVWITEVLKFFLPAVILFFIARMVLQAYLGNEALKREEARKAGNRQVVLPLKLQAYERLVLLLERISLPQAVTRVLQPGMTALQFQILLTQNIREEYEHNMVQQIYVSQDAWARIKSAKEEVIRLINTVAAEIDSKSTAHELAALLLARSAEQGNNPVQDALSKLTAEVTLLY
jgi:hypothetical protein